MRTAFALTVLLLAAQASALPILPPHHCGCTLVDIGPEPHVNPPDPGWDPALTLAEIAALKAIDDAHEPMPEPTRWVEVCLEPKLPKTHDIPPGQGHGGGGQPGGGSTPDSVPEASVWSLLAFGGVGVWLRRRA